jgi:hypothetical protein
MSMPSKAGWVSEGRKLSMKDAEEMSRQTLKKHMLSDGIRA